MRPDQPEPDAASAPDDSARRPGAAGTSGRPTPRDAGEDPDRNREPDAAEPRSRERHPDAEPRSPESNPGTAESRSPERHPGTAESRSREGPADGAEPPSRAAQLAEHGRYREVVAGSERTAADRSAWADALPGLRAAWQDHKERYPEHARAAPRTEADGSWTSGDHRRLDPEQNTEAGKAHADLADEASRYILPALRRIEAADPERKLAGLKHMVKGEDRLKEKLADELAGKHTTIREAIGQVPDAVRFTLCYESQRYCDGVLVDVGRLKSEGFELIKLKNLWANNQYKGINTQWRRLDSGTRFEMQFHTPESLEAKELTHPAYERVRGSDLTLAERRERQSYFQLQ